MDESQKANEPEGASAWPKPSEVELPSPSTKRWAGAIALSLVGLPALIFGFMVMTADLNVQAGREAGAIAGGVALVIAGALFAIATGCVSAGIRVIRHEALGVPEWSCLLLAAVLNLKLAATALS